MFILCMQKEFNESHDFIPFSLLLRLSQEMLKFSVSFFIQRKLLLRRKV
jgi:hypothetical protein